MRCLLVVLVLVAGCHEEPRGPAPRPAPNQADALWALAPAGTKLGVIITPRGVRMLEHTWQDIATFVKTAPELAAPKVVLDYEVSQLGGATTLADLGLTTDKGAAFFYVDEKHSLLVVPLADRDKFLAKVHGTKGTPADQIPQMVCKTVRDVYASGDTEQVIDTLGTGPKTPPAFDARGDIEAFGENVPWMHVKRLATVLQLERGGFVAHGTVSGIPAAITKLLGESGPVTIDREHTAGFVSLSAAGLKALAPPIELGQGVTLASLAQSLAGPVMVSFPAGSYAFDARMPLADPTPARTLLDHCAELLPPALAAHLDGGACRIPLPALGTELKAWIEDKTLRLGLKDPPKPNTVALTPVASELISGTWNAAAWGRGSLLASPFSSVPPALLASQPLPMIMKLALMLSEAGVGARVVGDDIHYVAVLRTAWANPDDVVGKLAAFSTSDLFAGHGPEHAKEIAGTSTPLAADVQAGYDGLSPAFLLVGTYVIPAYFDSLKRTKRPVVTIDLERLAKNLKRVYAETGSFPFGDLPLTPAGGCCGPNLHCSGTPQDWAKGPWQMLDFTPSEPALYMFRYHSDGKTAEVDAVGDLDCDGVQITYRLKAGVDAEGKPSTELETPPPNTD